MNIELIIAGVLASFGALFGLSQINIKSLLPNYSQAQRLDIDVLARTMWGEARGEGEKGMHAVANVILNRLEHAQASTAQARRFGGTIEAICKKKWQFSAWNTNDQNFAKLQAVTAENTQFAQALDIARIAVEGNLPDITNGADHYHTNGVSPKWSKGAQTTALIGSHKFFNLA